MKYDTSSFNLPEYYQYLLNIFVGIYWYNMDILLLCIIEQWFDGLVQK